MFAAHTLLLYGDVFRNVIKYLGTPDISERQKGSFTSLRLCRLPVALLNPITAPPPGTQPCPSFLWNVFLLAIAHAFNPPMRLGTLNVRGYRHEPLLREAMKTARLDVLCITETHDGQDSVHHASHFDLHISGPRTKGSTSRHNGGVRLLSSPHYRLRYRAHLRTDSAQVIVATLRPSLVVIGAYIAPVRGRAVMETVLAWIKPWLRGDAILLGDLNSRHCRWDCDTNTYGSTLLSWATANRATIYAPRAVTCLTALGASTVDLMVARTPRLDKVEVIAGMWDFITDHRLVVGQVYPPMDKMDVRIPIRMFADSNRVRSVIDSYRTSIPVIRDKAKAAMTTTDLNSSVEELQAALLRPWMEFCRRKPARFRPGWTRELDRLASTRKTLVRKAAKGSEAARLAAKDIDKTIKRLQRTRKRVLEHAAREATEHSPNPNNASDLHCAVRSALSAGQQSRNPTPDAYLEHLRTVFRPDPAVSVNTFTLDRDFEATVVQVIMAMTPGRAAGPDGITPRILRLAPEPIADCICAIWRTVGRLGHVPGALTLGRVTPVFKKGDHKLASNYRPICILNVLRRAMSAALDLRVRRWVTPHHRQWGFRKNMGTEHAIAHLSSRRRNGAKCITVLDLKGAYDRTPRHKLLQIVGRRLPSDLAGMVSSILVPGTIFVSGAADERIQVTSGVPQGDPLSPTLFNLFMDDFLTEMDNKVGSGAEPASCFADDVVLSASNRNSIQRYLQIAGEWATVNKMQWSVEKCAELIPAEGPVEAPLRLASQNIPQSTTVRYLGITLVANGVSTSALRDRLQKALARMGRIARAIPLRSISYEQRRLVILAHVFPLVDYASHLCPLPASARAIAALLERRASSWILDHPVRPHQTIRARSMARLAPLHLRRKQAAYRRIYGCRIALSLDSPDSPSAHRARLILSHPTVTELSLGAPQPPTRLKDALQNLQRKEWRRTMPGRRPVPTESKVPPALTKRTPPLLFKISAYYLNAIPRRSWCQIEEENQHRLKSLLQRERLTKSEHSIISQILTPLPI